jgi:hypothetical protein
MGLTPGYIGIGKHRPPWWRRLWQRIRPPATSKRLPVLDEDLERAARRAIEAGERYIRSRPGH